MLAGHNVLGGHAAAITANGSLWVWGGNTQGQLGLGEESEAWVSLPRRVGKLGGQELPASAAAVACGASHTAVILADSTLWVAGSNYLGACGFPESVHEVGVRPSKRKLQGKESKVSDRHLLMRHAFESQRNTAGPQLLPGRPERPHMLPGGSRGLQYRHLNQQGEGHGVWIESVGPVWHALCNSMQPCLPRLGTQHWLAQRRAICRPEIGGWNAAQLSLA